MDNKFSKRSAGNGEWNKRSNSGERNSGGERRPRFSKDEGGYAKKFTSSRDGNSRFEERSYNRPASGESRGYGDRGKFNGGGRSYRDGNTEQSERRYTSSRPYENKRDGNVRNDYNKKPYNSGERRYGNDDTRRDNREGGFRGARQESGNRYEGRRDNGNRYEGRPERRDDNRYDNRDNRYENRGRQENSRSGNRYDDNRGGERRERSSEYATERFSSRRSFGENASRGGGFEGRERRPYGGKSFSQGGERRFEKRDYQPREFDRDDVASLREKHYSKKKILAHKIKTVTESTDAELRLNRYISISGICSRRDADELIQSGRVRVNDIVVEKVGTKVSKKDKVEIDGEEIIPEKKVYLVLNKPKDFVTTMDDPLERKTVMNLIANACKERVYPVGRLDRQTTGVLLFTNDGDLAKKLTHPSYEHKKIYHVFLDKTITPQQLEQIKDGIMLEDGLIKADEISYASDNGKEVGIEIHSGRNRIVRRIFEHLGFKIEKLDRAYFAGITKKNLPRGKWRMLSKAEVDILKFY
ncbi:MAG: pseudouridine synthase [Marinifilaceae bacterium]